MAQFSKYLMLYLCRRQHLFMLCRTVMQSPLSRLTLVTKPAQSLAVHKRCFSNATFKKNHYEVLGIPRSASRKEIRLAFLKLSKKFHPDANITRSDNVKTRSESHKQFVLVNEAYSVLIKPLSRKEYDLTLDADKYVSRHMNASSNSSYTYGQNPGHDNYYHHRNPYTEANWNVNYDYGNSNEKFHLFTNIHFQIICFTTVVIVLVVYYAENFIPNPQLRHLRRNLSRYEIEKHELIMTSQHEGTTIYYYAIPKEIGSKDYEVMAIQRNKIGESDEPELVEVNSVYGNIMKKAEES
ncbi:uncharacterized protein LOC131956967 [Physella acuta]|uniref:uncharacterized protein LOC131956967 n=1 Tax=Physella acuta TaxID=109671 RepID=UPI0027DBA164|nr:uncharacterized protein LOC131956967 [Physella acuta]XP_059177615.1 uncharacterized protein LOC131956967 [Physella acuta]XP_059177616.1 uncharacterized protein LOC131956967 [Physella acuta]XP_059177617.1 uncharacterized protein LOC131956967 [Physella acuta]XP_059177618.1 uncharacterized protein LOC131956967 [Physella acuta]XP_059177619.1 uncharacterized protein LOC131956967 [Physella acuta]XP_059177620.1 uncharacterized protein LOC131956967 [Physella acuta]